jgi:hypothetical protein
MSGWSATWTRPGRDTGSPTTRRRTHRTVTALRRHGHLAIKIEKNRTRYVLAMTGLDLAAAKTGFTVASTSRLPTPARWPAGPRCWLCVDGGLVRTAAATLTPWTSAVPGWHAVGLSRPRHRSASIRCNKAGSAFVDVV